MDHKEIVRTGYNVMAESYLASKDPDDPVILGVLEDLALRVPEGAAVLDLGCGAGVPATRVLARRFRVTGVDISERQLELASQQVPGATFVRADMAAVQFPPNSFAAVVSFYAIIHLPREEQPALLRSIYDWLQPGGLFLANWSPSQWEGAEENWEGWGATMWWSHHDADTNLAMLREAGFGVLSAQQINSHGETWLWVLAQKKIRKLQEQRQYSFPNFDRQGANCSRSL